jgi:hypothetical protein
MKAILIILFFILIGCNENYILPKSNEERAVSKRDSTVRIQSVYFNDLRKGKTKKLELNGTNGN